MPTAWRIVKTRHVAEAFDGEGARRFGGRWSSPGTAVVYTASSQSLAALELLVHLQASQILDSYSVIPVTFEEHLIEVAELGALPADWRQSPVPITVQAIGDQWVEEQRSVVLRVPSVIIPVERNFLLNPAHRDFAVVTVGAASSFQFDPRLK